MLNDEHPNDVGCPMATQILGYQSKCYDCEIPICFCDLRSTTRTLIRESGAIKYAYHMADKSWSSARIGILVGKHRNTVNRWLQLRHKIEPMLNTYMDMQKYVEELDKVAQCRT